MADKSKIEWTDASWTPIRARNKETGKIGWHCEHATTGCGTPTEGGCYAEAINRRLGTGLPFKPGHREDIEIFLDDKMLTAPLRWRKPRMIFVCSMTDAFADFVTDEMLDKIFAVMALCPQHTFQVLTKRAERMRTYVTAFNLEAVARYHAPSITQKLQRTWPLPNVWLGVSAERQQEADERIPHLLQTPAAVRFVSAEPLLGPVDLTRFSPVDADWNPRAAAVGNLIGLDWLIVGGESGPNARPMHPDWARSLRDQCEAAGVPFFFKQWGAWAPGTWTDLGGETKFSPHDASVMVPDLSDHGAWKDRVHWFNEREAPEGEGALMVGKKRAGRLLDGKEHNDMPEKAGG